MNKKRRFIENIIYSLLYLFIKTNLFFSKIINASELNTKVLTSNLFLKFKVSPNHPENPGRIKYIINHFKEKKILNLLDKKSFSYDVEKWIKEIHSTKHINELKKNHSIAEKTSQIATKICLIGVDNIMNGEVKNIFCAVRPPGHHALNTGKDEGFCYYNHIAITAKYIQKQYKLKKILIIDWDYHHGNSTEYFFYDDPSVLFFSTHDQFAYPGTGSPLRKGIGNGKGFNINVHLPCKTNDNDIIDIFRKVLLPKAEKFKPEFVLISAGFDSRIDDLLGCYNVTDEGFYKLTRICMKIAKKFSNHRLLSILEGGYNLEGNTKACLAHVKALNKLI